MIQPLQVPYQAFQEFDTLAKTKFLNPFGYSTYLTAYARPSCRDNFTAHQRQEKSQKSAALAQAVKAGVNSIENN